MRNFVERPQGGLTKNLLAAELAAETGAELFLPPPALCGDNAAMIGCAGYYAYLAGTRGDLTQNAFATMSPEERF